MKRTCPNCHNDMILELLINDEKMESRLHYYCNGCGFDIDADPFNEKHREAMSKFYIVIKKVLKKSLTNR